MRLAHRPTQSALPGRTPLDIRLGLTNAADVAHPLRWGILGAAKICEDWARALRDVPGAETVAVAARSQDSAQAFADKMGLPKAYEGYEALAADPDIDIVYIGSKTPDHFDHCMMCIKAGKNVLCEKPFTETAAQAREVYAAAAEAGLFCQEGMWTRFFPVYEHARQAIAAGAIGDVQIVQSDYPDRVYALCPAPLAFGADEAPLVSASGVAESPGGRPNAAVLQYGTKGIGVITFPQGGVKFPEGALPTLRLLSAHCSLAFAQCAISSALKAESRLAWGMARRLLAAPRPRITRSSSPSPQVSLCAPAFCLRTWLCFIWFERPQAVGGSATWARLTTASGAGRAPATSGS